MTRLQKGLDSAVINQLPWLMSSHDMQLNDALDYGQAFASLSLNKLVDLTRVYLFNGRFLQRDSNVIFGFL